MNKTVAITTGVIASVVVVTAAYKLGETNGKAKIASLVKSLVIDIMKDQLQENS